MSVINNKYDFVFLFDVQDGNPNGDPDAGNLPRIDAETGIGLVTDVCLKRKVRNYLQLYYAKKDHMDILVKSKEISGEETVINREIQNAYDDIQKASEEELCKKARPKADAKEKYKNIKVSDVQQKMCEMFYDVRTFGAVLSTGLNAGQVRGPIQLTFARSIDPISTSEHSISVCAARCEEKSYDAQIGIQGRKSTVPYGLYMCHGFVSANFAQRTGFSEEDLQIFWQALEHLFDEDHSAARGLMSARKLIVFKHDSSLGNISASQLFDLVTVEKNSDNVPRKFTDYTVRIDRANLPQGVELLELL